MLLAVRVSRYGCTRDARRVGSPVEAGAKRRQKRTEGKGKPLKAGNKRRGKRTPHPPPTSSDHLRSVSSRPFRSQPDPSRRHASLVRFNKIGRENNRINNRNNSPSPENNRGGCVREQITLEVPKRWVTTGSV